MFVLGVLGVFGFVMAIPVIVAIWLAGLIWQPASPVPSGFRAY